MINLSGDGYSIITELSFSESFSFFNFANKTIKIIVVDRKITVNTIKVIKHGNF